MLSTPHVNPNDHEEEVIRSDNNGVEIIERFGCLRRTQHGAHTNEDVQLTARKKSLMSWVM